MAELYIKAYARDYDNVGSNESGTGEIKLSGSQFFENGGSHSISVSSDDFRFRAEIKIELVD